MERLPYGKYVGVAVDDSALGGYSSFTREYEINAQMRISNRKFLEQYSISEIVGGLVDDIDVKKSNYRHKNGWHRWQHMKELGLVNDNSFVRDLDYLV